MRVVADVISLQTFFANSLNEFGDDADVEGALAKLGLKDMHDKVPGLLVNLMAHQVWHATFHRSAWLIDQVLGVKFMIAQEQKASMRGGMLLDEQGLGKVRFQIRSASLVPGSSGRPYKRSESLLPTHPRIRRSRPLSLLPR